VDDKYKYENLEKKGNMSMFDKKRDLADIGFKFLKENKFQKGEKTCIPK
jgi:hypothetical protein